MGNWSDPENWRRLCSGESCPICLQGRPFNIIAELDISWLTAAEEAPLKGTSALFSRRHVVELHDLSSEEAAAFIHDLQRASKAVHEATGAVKMNYEIHGNTIPHLHAHLFPRYVGDPFEGRPIDPKVIAPAYGPGEFADFVARVRGLLR